MNKRRATWINNHQKINDFIKAYTSEEKHFPSLSNIAKQTNLSRCTVYDHMQSIETTVLTDEEANKLKMVTLIIWQRLALRGDLEATKLLLKYRPC